MRHVVPVACDLVKGRKDEGTRRKYKEGVDWESGVPVSVVSTIVFFPLL